MPSNKSLDSRWTYLIKKINDVKLNLQFLFIYLNIKKNTLKNISDEIYKQNNSSKKKKKNKKLKQKSSYVM